MHDDVIPLDGDANAEATILERQAARESNARSYARAFPFAIASGAGTEVTSVSGKRYLDFFMGAGALPLGHSPPELVEVAQQQLATFTHGMDVPTPARDAFVTALLSTLPPEMSEKYKVHICAPTGSDAVEAALKLCRIATGRRGVAAFSGSYHGGTTGALAVSSQGGLPDLARGGGPEVSFSPYAHCSRCPVGLVRETCSVNCAGPFEALLHDERRGPSLPSAAIVEVVQGEGGTVPSPPEFLRRVSAACTAAYVPLVVDEVQTGLGRCGHWWAFSESGIQPDVVVTSKALGGMGLPLAAIVYRAELDVWPPGAHIGTFRGHQPAMAAFSKFVEIVRRDSLLENARRRGKELVDGLSAIAATTPVAREARGVGLLLGLEFADPEDGRPLTTFASDVRAACFERGLIVELGGRGDATLRLLPPLNVSAAEVADALSRIDDAVRAVSSRGDLK